MYACTIYEWLSFDGRLVAMNAHVLAFGKGDFIGFFCTLTFLDILGETMCTLYFNCYLIRWLALECNKIMIIY